MDCEKCKYHYLKDGKESRVIYNPLTSMDQTIEGDKTYHMCGESPQGVFLDDNRPKCNKFNER